MNKDTLNVERAPRFPSGLWTGFFLQHWMLGRQRMDLGLTWSDGELAGSGRDRVGRFTVTGTYDPATGMCAWTKKYSGKHSVAYRGVNDGHGIWGVWEIRLFGGLYLDYGGFHIWPDGTDVSEESDRTERAVLAVMHEEFGRGPSAAARALLLLASAVTAGLVLWWQFRF